MLKCSKLRSSAFHLDRPALLFQLLHKAEVKHEMKLSEQRDDLRGAEVLMVFKRKSKLKRFGFNIYTCFNL